MEKHIPTAMPWYRSKIIIGAAVSISLKLLVVFGLIDEIAPTDQAELIELIALLVSAIGDTVALGSRVTQKHAPEITKSTTSYLPRNNLSQRGHTKPKNRNFMIGLILLPLTGMMLMLSACNPQLQDFQTEAPAPLAEKVIDENTLILAYESFEFALDGVNLAIDTRLITPGSTTALNIANTIDDIQAALNAADEARLAANTKNYAEAITRARNSIAKLRNIFQKGIK